MSEGDNLPGGYHKRAVDPKWVKKIREGGKKADQIRRASEAQHQKMEVPVADAQLKKDLEKL